MRISISNLAWDPAIDDDVSELLSSLKINAIDIAPGKYFKNFSTTSDSDIRKVSDYWSSFGIDIVGMQALLFGKPNFNVFGDEDNRTNLLQHLSDVCRIGASLGARRLVFGSPKNRDRKHKTDTEALGIACDFFYKLGEIARSWNVLICLEPNPVHYGSNFMINSEDTAAVVNAVNHSSILMQFDTGALTINGEEAEATLKAHLSIIGHVHVSEPDLLPVGESDTNHLVIAKALKTHMPDAIATIEMLTGKTRSPLVEIQESVELVKSIYGR